jgi:hypothetical protein
MPAGSGENKQLAPVLTHFPSTVPNMTPITIQGKKKNNFYITFYFVSTLVCIAGMHF